MTGTAQRDRFRCSSGARANVDPLPESYYRGLQGTGSTARQSTYLGAWNDVTVPSPTPSEFRDDADARVVLAVVTRDLREDFGEEVNLLDAWIETLNSTCVLYRYRIGDIGVIGRRITFPPHAADDDPASTGNDWAQTIAEPLGTLARTLRRDELGILWAGLGPNDPFPVPPRWPLG
ncbi:hypothetical protein G1H11_12375 [Phytoactinopolyspora alkaliphila]|uniref:Uncharacterized protein n=1 Tax=Phytoactinopolyspora alkaliphila TaxID=1783498 RepID=A0A6N9YMA4_9ACTN|nr:hypothetical protein [Phytoactinopolyspora alkaliphila]NED96104.1 hypothetical protein [Phytoactinopolyspora alkaliphila]